MKFFKNNSNQTLSLFIIFCFYMISLDAICQSKIYDFKIHGGVVNQIQGDSQSSQFGAFIGAGVVRQAQLGRWDLDVSFVYLNKTTPTQIINTYEGISLKGQTNFLFKILPIGESYLYVGPGIAIHQPLNNNGDYNGPSFGANGKIMVPIRLSGVPFYCTYDFDYITIQGFGRNSIGVSFQL